MHLYIKSGECASGWMKVDNLCFSRSTTGKTRCTNTDCDEVSKVCTDQGARLPSKDELHAWLDNGGKRTSTFGVTSTRNGAKHWLLNENGDYGWHDWRCCDDPNRYYVCVKHTSAGPPLTPRSLITLQRPDRSFPPTLLWLHRLLCLPHLSCMQAHSKHKHVPPALRIDIHHRTLTCAHAQTS